MTTRWLVECEWSGYVSAQRRIVHREVFSGRPKFRQAVEKLHAITFTDGTRLLLSVRDCKPREVVQHLHSYTSLIEECAAHGLTTVRGLEDRKRKSAGGSN